MSRPLAIALLLAVTITAPAAALEMPVDLARLVRIEARRLGIDPQLVEAVMRRESAFNPRALSSKGAMGLMQLMPATARRFGVSDPWDPVQNVRGGCLYLKFLLDRYDGDIALVLAAYNAGEGAVDSHGGIPPYAETQAYVAAITADAGPPESPRPRPDLSVHWRHAPPAPGLFGRPARPGR